MTLPRHSRMHMQGIAVLAVPTLVITGLATLTAAAPAAAVELPARAELFHVGESASGESTEPFLTPDGQRVVFASTAADLVEGDHNAVADIFVSTAIPDSPAPFSGTPLLVSAPDGPVGGERANGPSSQPVASADGRFVAFTSSASNLTADASTAGRTHIFVRDTLLDRTFRVQGSAEPNADSFEPDLSDDGRHLVFTSNADNLVAGGAVADTNGAADTYRADLDGDGDGVLGDVALTKAFPTHDVHTGTYGAVISGNGDAIALLTRGHPGGGLTERVLPSLWVTDRAFADTQLVSTDASAPSIDATGTTFAYVKAAACQGLPAVVATTMNGGQIMYSVALGTIEADARAGWVDFPQISPHGTAVAWATTVPPFDFDAGGVVPDPLPVPVIRTQEIDWWDSVVGSITCAPSFTPDWIDIAEGTRPSLSVAGRTIAHQSPEPSGIAVVDTNPLRPLSASSVGGGLLTPGFMTQVIISDIPVSTLRDYAEQLASAPVYRLPVYRLPVYRLPVYRLPVYRLLIDDSPVYRLPVYRLPVYRLPVYRLDLPGGWDQILADTPYAGELIQTVTLDEVLGWAARILDDGIPATDAERAAAERIRSLTLQDLALDDSGLAGLSLSSFAMGSAPVEQIPIAGDGDPRARWQALVDAQGIDLVVDDTTLLAELDSAGLALDDSGIEDVALRDLPIPQTLFSEIPVDRLFLAGTPLGAVDVSGLGAETREALFGTTEVTGTLEAPSVPLTSGATAADLAAGAPPEVTFGTLLFSLLDAANYPWEEIAPSAIDPSYAQERSQGWGCTDRVRCTYSAPFRFAFDLGPGESEVGPSDDALVVTAPTATITLPASTTATQVFASGSGPGVTWTEYAEYTGPVISSGSRVTAPLPDLRAGTVIELAAWFSPSSTVTRFAATGSITSGIYADSAAIADSAPLSAWDDSDHNYVDGTWQGTPTVLTEGRIYYEWISPRAILRDEETGAEITGPAEDEDFYLIEPPGPGKRLVVSTNATDGQVALALFSPSGSTSTAGLGIESAGTAPGIAVTEQTDFGDAAESGADTGGSIPGQTLIDQAVVRAGDAAEIEAASTGTAAGERLMVRVTSGNGQASSSMYSLRVRYIDEPGPMRCAPVVAPDMGEPGASDPVTDETNTLYLFDATRYAQTYGWEGADAVREALASMDGVGPAGSEVSGAVLSVDADPDVRAARSAYNGNPCSLAARSELTAEINRSVADAIEGHRDQITSVVVVGGDDILPFAPVPQNTAKFTEASHAGDLRLSTTPEGEPCPVDVPADTVDPCATPLSAAAAAGSILTDDPYGLARSYESLGGHLYVPTVGLGRLVETPAQIQASIARFVSADGAMDAAGQLAADSTLSGGYGAWSELPAQVTAALEWRSGQNDELSGTWTSQDMADGLFPADGTESPRIVSLNTHADERRMLPGVPGAEEGRFADTDLFVADDRTDSPQLEGTLVFLIGCHAGNNLPTAYYGDVDDWVDVFSSAGGYVGNTGYGLANNVTTALGERLLGLYAEWIGVEVDGRGVTSAQALAYAKQAYLGGLGLYSGYDEKVLMGAVYYGLPMYTFAPAASGEVKAPPVPEVPDGLTEVAEREGLLSASLRLQPTFDTLPADHGDGGVTYVTADGQAPAVVPGQPVLPRLVSALDEAPPGLVARGALITALTSVTESGLTPAVAAAGVGVPETDISRTDVAFPSRYATVASQDTPSGPVDLLVVTPARVEVARDGTGSIEKFTDMTVDVVYGPADSDDAAAPALTYVSIPRAGGSGMRFRADGTGSAVASMILLVQREGESVWERVPVTAEGDDWVATVPNDGSPFRWILQVVDAAGNVATETRRGHLDEAAAVAPSLAPSGGDTTVEAGTRLMRSVEVTDAEPGERFTATVTVTSSSDVIASSVAFVETDGAATHARIDQLFTTPGTFGVRLDVCRESSCTSETFDVEVPVGNSAPAATVSLEADGPAVFPTSVLTATGAGTDPDLDDVTLSYAWTRNGQTVGADAATLALDGLVQPGDVIAVTVTPHDGRTAGHAASAWVLVEAPPPVPPLISATATTAEGDYIAGSWSRLPVTVAFTCTTSAPGVTLCPETVTVDTDTAPSGRLVTGTMTDSLGRTDETSVLVKLDRTPPALAPSVSPATVDVGGTAVATANATDGGGSGIATQSCTAPDTATAGAKTVTCTATDNAGNSATATAAYTVNDPSPSVPTITATATSGSRSYAEGTWSSGPVKVTFTCTSGAAVVSCTTPKTTAKDTGAEGVLVIGTVRDVLGRTAQVSFLVKVDRTPPKLAPVVTPSPVAAGAAATAAANATDAASGVVSQSCETPVTTKVGIKHVRCTATDAAGNTASAKATYMVVPAYPPPRFTFLSWLIGLLRHWLLW